jgi:DNA-binding IclR family transcriptional regulator
MIKSARRVLEVLEFFDQTHTAATVMDISRALGYPQSSTSELLRCLQGLGYLQYNRYSRIYRPTVRVGLIGAWVEPNFFRDGLLLSTIDTIARATGHTVVLSSAMNYVVQHLHVVPGSRPDAVAVQINDTEPLLHSAAGRLLLSSYSQAHIRSAIHRLNAEETNPEMRVRLQETVVELTKLRAVGWITEVDREAGHGMVAAMIPHQDGVQRIVLSVVAPCQQIDDHADEILEIIQSTSLYKASRPNTPAAAARLPGAETAALRA